MNKSEKVARRKLIRAELYSMSDKLDRLFDVCSPSEVLTPSEYDLYCDLGFNLSQLVDAFED